MQTRAVAFFSNPIPWGDLFDYIETLLFEKKTILLVDDQRDVLRLLASSIKSVVKRVDIIESFCAEEAILEMTRIKIDLVISDYRLPGINGIELCQKIRHRSANMPVIIISGVSAPKLLENIYKELDSPNETSQTYFFQKPVPIGELLDIVTRCLY